MSVTDESSEVAYAEYFAHTAGSAPLEDGNGGDQNPLTTPALMAAEEQPPNGSSNGGWVEREKKALTELVKDVATDRLNNEVEKRMDRVDAEDGPGGSLSVGGNVEEGKKTPGTPDLCSECGSCDGDCCSGWFT